MILALVLTCGIQSRAQQHCHVELVSGVNEFQIVPSGEDLRMVVANGVDYFYPEDPGLPMLPLRTISVLVPNGAVLTNFSFTAEKEVVAKNMDLRGAIAPVPVTAREISRRPAMPFRGSFPESTLLYNSTLIQRGYTWFSFTFSHTTEPGCGIQDQRGRDLGDPAQARCPSKAKECVA